MICSGFAVRSAGTRVSRLETPPTGRRLHHLIDASFLRSMRLIHSCN
jgi:hypothetical protein